MRGPKFFHYAVRNEKIIGPHPPSFAGCLGPPSIHIHPEGCLGPPSVHIHPQSELDEPLLIHEVVCDTAGREQVRQRMRPCLWLR